MHFFSSTGLSGSAQPTIVVYPQLLAAATSFSSDLMVDPAVLKTCRKIRSWGGFSVSPWEHCRSEKESLSAGGDKRRPALKFFCGRPFSTTTTGAAGGSFFSSSTTGAAGGDRWSANQPWFMRCLVSCGGGGGGGKEDVVAGPGGDNFIVKFRRTKVQDINIKIEGRPCAWKSP